MAILMCGPDHFGIEYEINPWMHMSTTVDRGMARRQWQRLREEYERLGERVELAPPRAGLPDMVFTANAGLVRGRDAVLSRFRHLERRGEEEHWRRALGERGLRIHELPEGIAFEGAGDALFVGDRLFAAHGFRTDRAAHRELAELLGVEVISLRLVDPRFYHLDTCFSPLGSDTVLFAPQAFSEASARRIRRAVPHVIEVPVDVAAGFACNAIVVGDRLISSLAAETLEEPLHHAGLRCLPLPMSEFMKSGGGVRCLSLPLAAAA